MGGSLKQEEIALGHEKLMIVSVEIYEPLFHSQLKRRMRNKTRKKGNRMFYWGAVNKLRHKNIKVDFQKKEFMKF